MELKLDAAKWRKRKGMRRLLDALGADQGLTRYVGGAVRDELLGLPVSDVDLATQLRPEDAVERLEKAKIKVIPTGIDHGTVTAVSDGVATVAGTRPVLSGLSYTGNSCLETTCVTG